MLLKNIVYFMIYLLNLLVSMYGEGVLIALLKINKQIKLWDKLFSPVLFKIEEW